MISKGLHSIRKSQKMIRRFYRGLPHMCYFAAKSFRGLLHGDIYGQRLLQARLKKLATKDRLKVIFCTSQDILEDIQVDDEIDLEVISYQDLKEIGGPKKSKADLCIIRAHGPQLNVIHTARKKSLAEVYVLWMYDNHLPFAGNRRAASLSDIYFASHAYTASQLKNKYAIDGGHLPVSCCQFSRKLVIREYEKSLGISQSDDLYGGFVNYGQYNSSVGVKRNQLVRHCQEGLSHVALSLVDQSECGSYWGKSREERFLDWRKHKVSLALPIDRDLGCRLFDAFLAGQIPIVPLDVEDLDQVIPPDVQEDLPIVRLEEYTVESVQKAWKEAVRLHDQGGEAGMLKRHLFAANHHMEIHRLRQMIKTIRMMGA